MHVFRVVTVVWGTAYLVEAAARIVIVANTPTGTAFGVSKVMPYPVTAALVVWNVAYGRLQKRRGRPWPPRPPPSHHDPLRSRVRGMAQGGRATDRYLCWIWNWVHAVVKW